MPGSAGLSGRRDRPRGAVRRGTRYGGIALTLLALGVLLSACGFVSGHPQDTLDVRGDYNQEVFNLYTLVFWLAAVVFVLVEGILLYSLIRFRRRVGDRLPAQIHGNNRLEVAWTIAPAILLLVVAVPTLRTIANTSKVPPPGPNVVEINIIGHQWWWEVQYPNDKVVTANEIHIPLGKQAVFRLTSADVQHSFWFPKMAGKMDVLPNRMNYLTFTPQQTGEFYGQCVELCGSSHANMRLRLFVDSPADFAAWVKNQQQQAAAATTDLAKQGQAVFMRSACVGCHTIDGTNAKGMVGPNLTHVGSRTTIAAGVLDNTPANMKAWIEDPAAIKPGIYPNVRPGYFMPAFQGTLSAQDLDAIVAYLETLK